MAELVLQYTSNNTEYVRTLAASYGEGWGQHPLRDDVVLTRAISAVTSDGEVAVTAYTAAWTPEHEKPLQSFAKTAWSGLSSMLRRGEDTRLYVGIEPSSNLPDEQVQAGIHQAIGYVLRKEARRSSDLLSLSTAHALAAGESVMARSLIGFMTEGLAFTPTGRSGVYHNLLGLDGRYQEFQFDMRGLRRALR